MSEQKQLNTQHSKLNLPQLRFPEFQGEWEKTTIADVADKITDGTHDTPKPTESGIPYLTAIHVKNGSIDYGAAYFLPKYEHNRIYKRCNPERGDLLMVNIGAGTANSCIVEVDYEFSLKNVALIKPNRGKIFPQFLAQIQMMNSGRLRHQLSSGGAQPFLSLKQIGKLGFNITVTEEQQKIATFLTAVDQKIELLLRKKDQLTAYKKGMMQKLFSQEIRFKDDHGNNFPDWKEKKLGEVADIIGGGTPSTTTPEYWSGEIDWFTPTEIKSKYLLGSERKISSLGLQKSSAKMLPIGTLLLSTRATVGDVGIALKECTTNQGFQSLVVEEEFFNEFWYYWIQMNKKAFLRRSSGSTFIEISKSEILKISALCPSHNEQQKIANFLTALDQKIDLTTQNLTQAQTFKKALLQQMFV